MTTDKVEQLNPGLDLSKLTEALRDFKQALQETFPQVPEDPPQDDMSSVDGEFNSLFREAVRTLDGGQGFEQKLQYNLYMSISDSLDEFSTIVRELPNLECSEHLRSKVLRLNLLTKWVKKQVEELYCSRLQDTQDG